MLFSQRRRFNFPCTPTLTDLHLFCLPSCSTKDLLFLQAELLSPELPHHLSRSFLSLQEDGFHSRALNNLSMAANTATIEGKSSESNSIYRPGTERQIHVLDCGVTLFLEITMCSILCKIQARVPRENNVYTPEKHARSHDFLCTQSKRDTDR